MIKAVFGVIISVMCYVTRRDGRRARSFALESRAVHHNIVIASHGNSVETVPESLA